MADLTAEQVTQGMDLAGRTYLVTGTTTGIGAETARVLAMRGATVLAAARSLARANEACCRVDAGKGRLIPVACDLESPASVRECVMATKSTPIDAIVCNAGVALPELKLVHGVEAQFFTNHVGHFALVNGLLDSLKPNGRVVMVASEAHLQSPKEGIDFDNLDGSRTEFDSFQTYGRSKLANVLFAKELARRLKSQGSAKTAYSCHPGVIQTELTRYFLPPGAAGSAPSVFPSDKTIEQGAATQVYLATAPNIEKHSGAYFKDCAPARARKIADDPALASKLWTESERIMSRL